MTSVRWFRPWEIAGLATRSLRERFARGPQRREAAVQRLVTHLGRLHGLPQRMGQIIASAELDGDSRHFAPLPETPFEALPPGRVRRRLRSLLRQSPGAVFAEFSDAGITASLAQVHRARLRDGQLVAVKLLLPDIARTIRADLAVLGWLHRPAGPSRAGFDVRAYRTILAQRLAAELDTAREAEWLHRFGAWTAHAPDVLVPRVIEALLRPDLLVLTWLEGETIDTARTWPEEVRRALGTTLVRLFLESALVWRALHADPHPDNYRFVRTGPQATPAVGLLDFGTVQEVSPALAAALAHTIFALRAGRLTPAVAWELHRALGFDLVAIAPLREQLPAWLGALLQPLAEDRPFDLSDWEPEPMLTTTLGAQRMAYRSAAPPDLGFLIRAWHGLIHYLRTLAVPVNWGAVFTSLPLPAPAWSEAAAPVASCPATTTLQVRVLRSSKELLNVRLPATCLPILADLVPEDLRPALTRQGIDLPGLIAHAEETASAPQEIFTLSEGDRMIRVWLE